MQALSDEGMFGELLDEMLDEFNHPSIGPGQTDAAIYRVTLNIPALRIIVFV